MTDQFQVPGWFETTQWRFIDRECRILDVGAGLTTICILLPGEDRPLVNIPFPDSTRALAFARSLMEFLSGPVEYALAPEPSVPISRLRKLVNTWKAEAVKYVGPKELKSVVQTVVSQNSVDITRLIAEAKEN